MKNRKLLQLLAFLIVGCFQNKAEKNLTINEKPLKRAAVISLKRAADEKNLGEFTKCLQDPTVLEIGREILAHVLLLNLPNCFLDAIFSALDRLSQNPNFDEEKLRAIKTRLIEHPYTIDGTIKATPIIIATKNSNEYALNKLIIAGANTNSSTSEGNALHYAVISNNTIIANTLINENPFLMYEKSQSENLEPIYYAIAPEFNQEMFNLLINYTFDATFLTEVLNRLSNCKEWGCYERAVYDIKNRRLELNRLLISCYRSSNLEMLKSLLARNAYIPLEIKADNLAFISLQNNNFEILSLIQECENRIFNKLVNLKYFFISNENTVLGMAALQNNPILFKYLLSKATNKDILLSSLRFILSEQDACDPIYVEAILYEAHKQNCIKEIVNGVNINNLPLVMQCDLIDEQPILIEFLRYVRIINPKILKQLIIQMSDGFDKEFVEYLFTKEKDIAVFLFSNYEHILSVLRISYLECLYNFAPVQQAINSNIVAALHFVIKKKKDPEFLEFLITKCNADINSIIEGGEEYPLTALGLAIYYQNKKAIKFLLAKKPQVLTSVMYDYISELLTVEELDEIIRENELEEYMIEHLK